MLEVGWYAHFWIIIFMKEILHYLAAVSVSLFKIRWNNSSITNFFQWSFWLLLLLCHFWLNLGWLIATLWFVTLYAQYSDNLWLLKALQRILLCQLHYLRSFQLVAIEHRFWSFRCKVSCFQSCCFHMSF